MPEGKNTEQLKAKPRTPKVPSQTLLTRAVVRNRLSSDFWKKIGGKKETQNGFMTTLILHARKKKKGFY